MSIREPCRLTSATDQPTRYSPSPSAEPEADTTQVVSSGRIATPSRVAPSTHGAAFGVEHHSLESAAGRCEPATAGAAADGITSPTAATVARTLSPARRFMVE